MDPFPRPVAMANIPKFAFLLAAAVGSSHASEVLTICGAPFPPYSYLDHGVPAGIDVEVAKNVFGQLKVPVTFQIEPFARCQEALKVGAADVAMAVSNKLDRHTYAFFPRTPVWKTSFVFFTNAETKRKYDIRGLDDAKRSKLKIGIVRGAIYDESFWAVFPNQNPNVNEGYHEALVPAPDTAANFRQLEFNHVQLYPQDRIAGLWEMEKAEHSIANYYDTVLFSKDYFHAFAKASRYSSASYPDILALLHPYDARLAEFKKSDKYRALFAGFR
jgi:polar amino acid transport system substrate-binding protein